MPSDNESEINKVELTSVAEGAGIALIGKILGSVLQYLYTITLARLLDIQLFGLFMLGITIVNLAGVISRLGLDNGVIRFIALYNGLSDMRRVKGIIVQSLGYTFIMSCFVGSILFLSAEYISSNIFHKPSLEAVIKLISVSLPFLSIMSIALSATNGFKIMRYRVYCQNLLWPSSNLIMVLIFFVIGYKLHGAVAAYMFSAVLTSILSIYYLIKTFPQIRDIKAIFETKKLMRFSVPLLVVVFFNFLIMWTDTLMLGYFRSSSEVGVYNAAVKTAMLIGIILTSFTSIFAPMVSDLHHRREMQKLESLFKTTTKWIYTLSFPTFLLIAFLSRDIMLLFGKNFLEGSTPLLILAFAQLLNAGAGSVGIMLTMSGRQDLMLINTVVISLLNILLNYILIPSHGVVGACIASGTSVIILNIIMLLEIFVLMKMHPYSRSFIKPTLSGVVAFIIIWCMRYILNDLGEIQKVLIALPLFLTVFIGLIYKWGIEDEDKVIVDLFKKKLLRSMS